MLSRRKKEVGRRKKEGKNYSQCPMPNAQYPTVRLARSRNLIPAHPKIDRTQEKITLSVGMIPKLAKS
jgi:hypothetical protein